MNFDEKQIRRFGLALIFYALAVVGLVWFFNSITPQAQANLNTAQFALALNDAAAQSSLAADAEARRELKTFLIWDSAAFVPLFLAFLLLMSFVLARRSSGWAKIAAWLLAIVAIAAAFADWTENFRFYELLETAFVGESAAENVRVVNWATQVKWLALLVASAISSAVFWRGGWWNVAAILILTTSLAGLFGLANYRPLIGYSLAAQLLILLVVGAVLAFSQSARQSFLRRRDGALNSMADKKPFPDWVKDKPGESLEAIRSWAVANAEQSIWYYREKKQHDRPFSKRLRFFSIFFVSIGALCPLIDATRVVEKYYASGVLLGQWGYVFLAIGAAIVGFDFYFGHSSGWMRFVLTETAIERALKEFQYDWAMLEAQPPEAPPVGAERTLAFLQLAKKFTLEVENLTKREVDSWVLEFQTNIAHLEKVLKADRKNNQRQ